nr:origin of replication complex subunit 1A-like [Ipomoea batatas]
MIKPKFLVSLTEFYIFGISFIWELILHYMGIWDVAQGMAMGRDLKVSFNSLDQENREDDMKRAEDINMLKRLQTNTMMIRSSSRFSKILLAAMVYELHKTGMCETTFEKVSTFGPLGLNVGTFRARRCSMVITLATALQSSNLLAFARLPSRFASGASLFGFLPPN